MSKTKLHVWSVNHSAFIGLFYRLPTEWIDSKWTMWIHQVTWNCRKLKCTETARRATKCSCKTPLGDRSSQIERTGYLTDSYPVQWHWQPCPNGLSSNTDNLFEMNVLSIWQWLAHELVTPTHRRSQDFVWGCIYSLKKLTTFFSRHPEKII